MLPPRQNIHTKTENHIPVSILGCWFLSAYPSVNV